MKQKPQPYNPKTCWVGDAKKICYPDEETARLSARLAEVEHNMAPGALAVYKCEYGEHWHLKHQNSDEL